MVICVNMVYGCPLTQVPLSPLSLNVPFKKHPFINIYGALLKWGFNWVLNLGSPADPISHGNGPISCEHQIRTQTSMHFLVDNIAEELLKFTD